MKIPTQSSYRVDTIFVRVVNNQTGPAAFEALPQWLPVAQRQESVPKLANESFFRSVFQ